MDVVIANNITNRHANEFSEAAAGSAAMEAEKVMVCAFVCVFVVQHSRCNPRVPVQVREAV